MIILIRNTLVFSTTILVVSIGLCSDRSGQGGNTPVIEVNNNSVKGLVINNTDSFTFGSGAGGN